MVYLSYNLKLEFVMIPIDVSALYFKDNRLEGEGVTHSRRTLGDLKGVFEDEEAYRSLPPETVAYEVSSHCPVAEGTPGGLFFGISYLHPVMVGNEYMMTKGHYHAQADRGEYYWGLQGEGLLLLMDENRQCRAEKVAPGTLHYIPGRVAHRLVNTGNEILAVGACWPSDAGHDYASIAESGFSVRVKNIDGEIQIVNTDACTR